MIEKIRVIYKLQFKVFSKLLKRDKLC